MMQNSCWFIYKIVTHTPLPQFQRLEKDQRIGASKVSFGWTSLIKLCPKFLALQVFLLYVSCRHTAIEFNNNSFYVHFLIRQRQLDCDPFQTLQLIVAPVETFHTAKNWIWLLLLLISRFPYLHFQITKACIPPSVIMKTFASDHRKFRK